ncbi:hypothetical protein Pyn_20116 [Prunus yedoensis var. nudiflora]|uniref:Uncharacterized protein n=1 Tax=Prunus yedoensis var. nudiflora TaxID=2094558 RepID=A0A315AA88_PRUYE|nr:hypothetical protein Pyn_20116 [Prunus yedoensis var. nudiflora]
MDFEAREGDEDEDLDDKGFGEEEVGDDDEGEGEEDEAACFNGDEHEVRERVPGDEERVVEVGGDQLVRHRFAHVARLDRYEGLDLVHSL